MVDRLFSDILWRERRDVDPQVLQQLLILAVQIAREGREGRKIGTLLVVGDAECVLERSRPLILDPLFGHPPESKRISDPNVHETIKELAQLDGAFIVSGDGIVLSAARYIDTCFKDLKLPLGFGSRHIAGASITRQTDAVAIVVSESSMIRVFDDGELISEIIPEVWMLRQHAQEALGSRFSERSGLDVTVRTRTE